MKQYKVTFVSGEVQMTDDLDKFLTALRWWLSEGVTGFKIDIVEV